MGPKEAFKKLPVSVQRPPISDSSLLYVPEDAVEGYQERIDTDIEWTLPEEAARHHKKLCLRQEIPQLLFSEALKNKLQSSLVGGFIDDESTMTLQEQYEFVVATSIWDNEKFGNDEAKACFLNDNCFTDDIVKLIKKAVKFDSREILMQEIKLINLLRVNHSQMTHLDSELQEFTNLVTLNCCDNFIEHLDSKLLPPGLRSLELQSNAIKSIEDFVEYLPTHLLYLGLGRNLLKSDAVESLSRLPHCITVLDLANNDIYDLQKVLDALIVLPNLTSLMLSGNPCALCAAYSQYTLTRLQRLKWLDNRQVLPTDRSEYYEHHPDDLRSTYFFFSVIRVMSLPQPPKPEKGAVLTFHVELELPLLDAKRRAFLMFRQHESLIEMIPLPEDDWPSTKTSSVKSAVMGEGSSHASDIYKTLEPKSSRIIYNYTIYESNRIQWSPIMTFQEPVVRIFCPDLTALRDTFRSVITVRLIYTQIVTIKPTKPDKKSVMGLKPPTGPSEHRVTLATIKCHLRTPDWSQPSQHFHWDDSLGTHDAIHWGDGDLSILQYTSVAAKPIKGKADTDTPASRQTPPDNFTCHFSFGIETLRG